MSRQVNVWDIQSRMQDIHDIIVKKLEELDGRNDRLHREYVGELRQLVGTAATIIEKAAKLEHQKQVVNIIIAEIAKESPSVRDRIMQRIQAVKELNLLFGD